MSLVDVMSAMRLHLFAEAAFVIAAAGFLTVVVTVFLRANRVPFERARLMPFDDDPPPRPMPEGRSGNGGDTAVRVSTGGDHL
jgi:cbb3-type cytochrome oxidase subunit 3